MSEPFYISKCQVVKIEGVHRRAVLEAGDTHLEAGVHGPIKAHYKIDGPDRPLPVDLVVGATGM